MSNRNRVGIPMNEVYKVIKDGNDVVIKKENGEDVTLVDKLSNTYPRSFKSLLGKVGSVENALIYLISDNMHLTEAKKPFNEIKPDLNKYLRRTHNVPYYNTLEHLFIADSILSSKALVYEILSYEDFADFENVDLLSVIRINSGVINTVEPYYKRKSYVKNLKKVIWEIKNAFSNLKETVKQESDSENTEELSPIIIKFLSTEQYKEFKNKIKEEIINKIIERYGEDTEILEGVRGTMQMSLKHLKDLWLK